MAENIFLDRRDLDEFGKDYVKKLVSLLRKYDKKASGSLINSIDYKVRGVAEEALIILEANDYLEYVDKGRKPGKYPPIKAISKWASIRGISQKAVFPIARSIFKFGIEPTNVIRDTMRWIENDAAMVKKYEDAISENLESIIMKKLTNNI